MPKSFFKKTVLELYEQALEQLKQIQAVYACQCTRKMLGSNHIYTGTCRDLRLDFSQQAIRLLRSLIASFVLMISFHKANNAQTCNMISAILS